MRAYAKVTKVDIVDEFYDPAVKGGDALDQRPGFTALVSRIIDNGVGTVLVEDASRFARDLAVQLAGYDHLKRLGIELVAVNAPDHFREDTPTAVLVRQVLGAIAQFEKAQLATKLRVARERVKARTGRCEGRKPVPRMLLRKPASLPGGQGRHTKVVAWELSPPMGHLSPSGRPYGAESVKRMLGDDHDQLADCSRSRRSCVVTVAETSPLGASAGRF